MKYLLAVLAASLIVLPNASAVAGVYVDSGGKYHEWKVTDDHGLLWDGSKYFPIGGVFVSRYASIPTENNLAWDNQALQKISENGIHDIYINASFTKINPSEFQRLIDALEKQGFRYGIQPSVSMRETAEGYYINPKDFISTASENGRISVDLSKKLPRGLKISNTALYVLIKKSGSCKGGEAPIDGTSINIKDTEIQSGDTVKIIPKVTSGDWISDNPTELLKWVSSIKPGPGYRFLLDPMGNEYSPPRYFFPSPSAWESEYSSWLSHSRGAPSSISGKIVPVTENLSIDLVSHKVESGASSATSWTYATEAIDEILRTRIYKNLDRLRAISGIPIIAKRHRESTRIWISLEPSQGFDGLGADSYGSGTRLLRFNALQSYAEAAQSKRPLWLLTTEYSQDAKLNSYIGYKNQNELWDGLDNLISNGTRGVFLFGLSLSSNDNDRVWQNYDLLKSPQNIKWLAQYKLKDSLTSQNPKIALTHDITSDDLRAFNPSLKNALNGAPSGQLSTEGTPSGYVIIPAFYPANKLKTCKELPETRVSASCGD